MVPSIRSSRVFVEGEIRPASIVFEDGVISDISDVAADRDFGDLVVLPGLVDTHVHVNDPGRASWEGFLSATRAAAAGGATTIVDMPLNSLPPTTTVEGLHAKRTAADGLLAVDVAFWGGLVPGTLEEIEGLVEAGVCGFKSFLVDSGVPEFPPVTLVQLREGMVEMGSHGLPALIHAEDPDSLEPMKGDPTHYLTYLDSRPVESERRAVESLAALTEETGASVHILHVSSGEVGDVVAASGRLTGETCPHYLTFAAEEIPSGGTLFKCAPPIREAEHRESLWACLRDEALSMVVSDHSPAPPRLKEVDTGDFAKAWGGISSLQLRLPATWTEASRRGFGSEDLAQWLAAAPARLAGLDDRKGSIAPGMHADFVVWDPDGVIEVRGMELEHRHPVTPYEGSRLRGRVVNTILRGRDVYAHGMVKGSRGRMLQRR